MSGRLREALQVMWEHVYFWCLILAIIALAVIVIGDPFGYRAWFEAHRFEVAVVSVACVIAAVGLGARRK